MADIDEKGTAPRRALLLLPRLPPRNGWETWAQSKADESHSLQDSETGTLKRALQPENKPLNQLVLLITGKRKTPLIYHQTLLSGAHFRILAMTFSSSKEYSFAYQPLLHQTDSTTQDAALHAWAGFNCLQCFPQHSLNTGVNLLMGT